MNIKETLENCKDILKFFEFYKIKKNNALFMNNTKTFIPESNNSIGDSDLKNQFIRDNNDGSNDEVGFFNELDIDTNKEMYKDYNFVKDYNHYSDNTRKNIIKFYFMLEILYKYCINLFINIQTKNGSYLQMFERNYSLGSYYQNDKYRDNICYEEIKIKNIDIYIDNIISFIKNKIVNINDANIEDTYKGLKDGSSFKKEESEKQKEAAEQAEVQAAKEQAAKEAEFQAAAKVQPKNYILRSLFKGGKKYLRNKKTINPRIKKTKKTKKTKKHR
jgi:hypothetical protein